MRRSLSTSRPFRPLFRNSSFQNHHHHQQPTKLLVVLDIDETLVHSTFEDPLQEKNIKYNSEVIDDNHEEEEEYKDHFHLSVEGFKVKVHRRPHLNWFLQEASKKFELATFTAGTEEYASRVLDVLDPTGELIRQRFYRQHCTQIGQHQYTKNLNVFNYSLSRTVLVDNNPMCFLPQPDNGIPVSSFYNQTNDNTLVTLMSFLDHLNGFSDVKRVLQESLRLKERLKPLEQELNFFSSSLEKKAML